MPFSSEKQQRTTTVRITRRARRAFVLGAAILLQACGSDAVNAPTGVPLSGSVVLQDTWGNNLLDYSGVVVSVDGLSAQAVTDRDGVWHFDDLPVGRYDITLKRATFGTMRILNQPVVGASSDAPKITMAVTPTAQAIVDARAQRSAQAPRSLSPAMRPRPRVAVMTIPSPRSACFRTPALAATSCK